MTTDFADTAVAFDHASPASTMRWFDSNKATGAAGLAFTATLIVQNALRGRAPQVQASAAEVTDYYHDNRAAEAFLIALFVFGIVCFTRFVGGLWTRLDREHQVVRRSARMGVLGVAAIVALFPAMLACEVGLVVGTNNADLASTV